MALSATRLRDSIKAALDAVFTAAPEPVNTYRTQASEALATSIVTEIGTTAQDAWTAPTFSGTWVNFGAPYASAGYMKDAEGRVWLRGMVKDGAAGSTIFQLPVGYRPPFQLTVPVIAGGATLGQVIVTTGGSVTLSSGSTAFASLDCISFRTT
jgi:hypothetical protein